MILKRFLFTIVVVSMQTVAAGPVKVEQCRDGDGEWLRDKCLPGMEKEREIELRGLGGIREDSIEAIAKANPITVFTIPDCDACDLVRNSLNTRGIPFTEKMVQDNAEAQTEMQEKTGGLVVPAVVIGDAVLTGYNREALDTNLEQAGYPIIVEKTKSLTQAP